MKRVQYDNSFKSSVISLWKAGQNQVDIANHLKINKSMVSRWIQNYKTIGTVVKPNPGAPPRKISDRDDRQIKILIIKKPFITSKEIVKSFNLNVDSSTVRKHFIKLGLKSYRAVKKPMLTKKHEKTITKEDNLPKIICCKCTARLKVAYTFVKTAHDSEHNLKNFLEKINSEFKEVTQGNKSNKIPNEPNFAEDDLFSLMDEENNDVIADADNNDVSETKSHIELGKNLSDDNSQNSKEVDLDKCKTEAGYSFSQDVLLIHATTEIDSEYENNSHFMEISTQDDEVKEHYNEEVEDQELENNQTYTNINILKSNEESKIRCQSSELAIEESGENHVYGTIINNQVDTMQCPNIYIDESSVEGTTQKEHSDYNINNLNEEENHEYKHKKGEIYEAISKKTVIVHRFYCDKCNRDFSTKTNLNRHMQSHEGNKPFSCTECKKSFTQKSTLKQHMYTHTGERPYVCEVCNRGFTQCKSLIFHMRRHTGEKPFHCEYCLITFRQKDALRIHILKHHVVIERAMDGTEVFSCIICQRKFATKLEFKTHMKAHTATGELDNVVELFRSEEEVSLTKIKKSSDTVIFTDSKCFNAAVVKVSASSAAEPSRAKKFQCRKCFKCFALKKSLVRHMRIHYAKDDDYLTECFECDLQFSSPELYQEHLSVCHQYACSACPEIVFKTIQELKVHMFEHDVDQHEQ